MGLRCCPNPGEQRRNCWRRRAYEILRRFTYIKDSLGMPSPKNGVKPSNRSRLRAMQRLQILPKINVTFENRHHFTLPSLRARHSSIDFLICPWRKKNFDVPLLSTTTLFSSTLISHTHIWVALRQNCLPFTNFSLSLNRWYASWFDGRTPRGKTLMAVLFR